MKRLLSVLLLAVLLSLTMAVNTFAYLDSSSVSYLFQVAVGAIVVSGAALAIYWKKIRLFFKKRKKKKTSNTVVMAKEEEPRKAE